MAFTIQAASIDSGTPDRDAHLRSEDFFHVEKCPALTFMGTGIMASGGNDQDVTGDLTVRGVTKRIRLRVTYLGKAKDPWGNEKIGFETETTLNRKDYGLVWNAALETDGFLVGDEVKISVYTQAQAPGLFCRFRARRDPEWQVRRAPAQCGRRERKDADPRPDRPA